MANRYNGGRSKRRLSLGITALLSLAVYSSLSNYWVGWSIFISSTSKSDGNHQHPSLPSSSRAPTASHPHTFVTNCRTNELRRRRLIHNTTRRFSANSVNLTNEDTMSVLQHFSDVGRYLLITNYETLKSNNSPLNTRARYRFRPQNLNIPPFALADPICEDVEIANGCVNALYKLPLRQWL